MKLSRIDQIALNGGDGAHYKYKEVADKIIHMMPEVSGYAYNYTEAKELIMKILVENFPDDAT